MENLATENNDPTPAPTQNMHHQMQMPQLNPQTFQNTENFQNQPTQPQQQVPSQVMPQQTQSNPQCQPGQQCQVPTQVIENLEVTETKEGFFSKNKKMIICGVLVALIVGYYLYKKKSGVKSTPATQPVAQTPGLVQSTPAPSSSVQQTVASSS